jgi:hypothetical protein
MGEGAGVAQATNTKIPTVPRSFISRSSESILPGSALRSDEADPREAGPVDR